MSWCNGTILTKEEVERKAGEMPSEFQIGEPVSFWIEDDAKFLKMEAYVVGVAISGAHTVRYDLAFAIAGSPYFIVAKDVRGRLSKLDEGFRPYQYVDNPLQQPTGKPRAALSLVPQG